MGDCFSGRINWTGSLPMELGSPVRAIIGGKNPNPLKISDTYFQPNVKKKLYITIR